MVAKASWLGIKIASIAPASFSTPALLLTLCENEKHGSFGRSFVSADYLDRRALEDTGLFNFFLVLI